jgi:hypothetical protein
MSTTVTTGTRAPRRQAPRRDDPRRAEPGRDGPRREDPGRDDRGRDEPGRVDLLRQDLRRDAAPPGTRRRPVSRRPARPAGDASRPRPAARAARQASDGAQPTSRTPFILLVLAMLGGGLVCLLLINTTLAAASFRISNLQQENTQGAQRIQQLQQQVSTDQSASSIEQRALRLGMRLQPTLNFIDLRTGRRYTDPAHGSGAVPGYTP